MSMVNFRSEPITSPKLCSAQVLVQRRCDDLLRTVILVVIEDIPRKPRCPERSPSFFFRGGIVRELQSFPPRHLKDRCFRSCSAWEVIRAESEHAICIQVSHDCRLKEPSWLAGDLFSPFEVTVSNKENFSK
jgi:hypothetical protein